MACSFAVGERYFPATGLVKCPVKGRLSDTNIQMMRFLHFWLSRAADDDYKDFDE